MPLQNLCSADTYCQACPEEEEQRSGGDGNRLSSWVQNQEGPSLDGLKACSQAGMIQPFLCKHSHLYVVLRTSSGIRPLAIEVRRQRQAGSLVKCSTGSDVHRPSSRVSNQEGVAFNGPQAGSHVSTIQANTYKHL